MALAQANGIEQGVQKGHPSIWDASTLEERHHLLMGKASLIKGMGHTCEGLGKAFFKVCFIFIYACMSVCL